MNDKRIEEEPPSKNPSPKNVKSSSCLHILRIRNMDGFVFGCKPMGQGRYSFGSLVFLGCHR